MLRRRRSYCPPITGLHYRPGIVEQTGGSFDLAGIWRPVTRGPHTLRFNDRAYDRTIHAFHYNLEDDYYGAYGDLLEFEANLRMNLRLSEEERLRRWRMRLAFEELEESQRLQRYKSMAETERILLGLSDYSWWGERYASQPFHHRPNWRTRFGNKIRGWDSSFLPLSSTLIGRFAPVWGGSVNHLAQSERMLGSQLQQAQNEIYREQLMDSERRLDQEIRHQELDNVGRRLAHQESYLRDRLEDNMLRDQERTLENNLMNEAIHDRELQYEREAFREQDRRLEREREDMMYEQEKRLEDRLEDEALYRGEQRLEDSAHYLQTADLLDSELRHPTDYHHETYPDYHHETYPDYHHETYPDYHETYPNYQESYPDHLETRADYQETYPDYAERDILADELRNDLDRERFERDLSY